MQEIECEGKTVSEAVDAALRKLGLRREQVEVKIIQEAKSGFMGIGAKPAKVKVGEKKWVGHDSEETSAKPAPKERSSNRSSQNGAKRPAPREKPVVSQRTPEAAYPEPVSKPAAAKKPSSEPRENASPSLTSIEAERARAVEIISQLLKLMACGAASAEIIWEEKQERFKASISGEDGERLIGEDGKTLDSLQMIANLILNRRGEGSIENRFLLQIDAFGWRDKKEKETIERALKAVEEVARTGKPYRLDPMDAATRRVIHKQLADHPEVVTGSEGEGSWRKIVIRPRNG